MPKRYTSRDWKRPSANQRFCELHHDESSLINALSDYAFQGLTEEEVVVIITSSSRQQGVVHALRERGLDVESLQRRSWLLMSDPAEFRDVLFVDGLPDRVRYRAAMDEMMATAGRYGQRKLRVYADLVDTLWREGNFDAVARMEEISQEYCVEHGLKAFCGYVLDAFMPSSYHRALEDVCRRHSGVAMTCNDERIRTAVDAASQEVMGLPLSVALRHAPARSGWHDRLPVARRTVLWLQSNMPWTMKRVLEKARDYYNDRRLHTLA